MALTKNLPILSGIESLRLKPRARVDAIGPWGSGKALAALQAAGERSLLIVTHGRSEAEAVFEDLLTFDVPGRCVHFPAWEVLPTDAMAPADDIVAERMNALMRAQIARKLNEPVRMVAPVRSLLQYVVKRDALEAQTVSLAVGEEHELEDLVAQLSELGYDRELMVEQRGQTSVRGGILDVFPISSELPYRIEFFSDE